MITEFVNGYNVTGNHATVGREYHICNAAGKVLDRAGGKVLAITAAAALPPGDVPAPPPEPEPDPEPEPKVLPLKVVAPPKKAAAKPKTARPKGAN